MTKSPLRYPGGKSRAVKIITERFPAGITEMVSPFFGGGSIELWAAQNGIRVYGYDGFKPLVAFWSNLLDSFTCIALIDEIQKFSPLTKQRFYETKKDFVDHHTFDIASAARFFVLNRASFSGTTMSGGCSEESVAERFTQSSIDRLRKFVEIDWSDRLSVGFNLWPDTLERHQSEFAYLDPPYIIRDRLYGINGDMHDKFDHKALAKALRTRDTPWLLSYNNCDAVKDLYSGLRIEEVSWSKSMSNGPSNELLIRNY